MTTRGIIPLLCTAISLAQGLPPPLFDGPPPSRQAVDREGRRPEPIYSAPGHCAWPNLKLLKDGRTLAALIFNSASHGHGPGDVECWLSRDGGTTWAFGSAVTQHEPDTIRMNHAAGLTTQGELIVLTSGWSGRWPAGARQTRGRFRFDVLGPWISRSPDSGFSWWVDKEGFPERSPTGQPSVPFGDLQIAGNGDLCATIYTTEERLTDRYEDRRFKAYLYRSRDDGRSWGNAALIGPANETTSLHLGGGNWLAIARIGSGVEKRDSLVLYGSTDDGRTWRLRRAMTGFQRVNGNLCRLRDGRILFTFGDRASPPGRRGLEASLSSDGGMTWSEPVRVADWNGLDGGYPSSVQRADGQVVTGYYCSALPGEPPESAKNYHFGTVIWDPVRTFIPSVQ
jgi:hypothetical protein